MSVIAAAKACHEANRIYCASIGDHNQPRWEEAPAWQQSSAIAGVRAVIADPLRGPGASHESWLEHKLKDGWVYGPVKDPDAEPPTHPCMVPFLELPMEQRMKDVLFLTVAKMTLEM